MEMYFASGKLGVNASNDVCDGDEDEDDGRGFLVGKVGLTVAALMARSLSAWNMTKGESGEKEGRGKEVGHPPDTDEGLG